MPAFSVCVEMVFADGPFPERVAAAADAGADAVEFWGWREKNLDAIAGACADEDVTLAAMLGAGEPLADPAGVHAAVESMETSLETADEYGVANLIVTVGQAIDDVPDDDQHDAVVESLSQVAPTAEDVGVTLAVEPLNTRVDHPGYYLTTSEEGFKIVNEVDSPAVGLLFDVYHQQITEGDVTRRLTEHVDDVAYVHVADNPGRNEPGTGEIDYGNVLGALTKTEYDGYVGCEFSPVGDDAAAVRRCREYLSG